MADDDVDRDRTKEAGNRSEPIRDAHQYTGVSRCDVQMVHVES